MIPYVQLQFGSRFATVVEHWNLKISMEDGPNVKCAFCEKVQPMCWARAVTSVTGCRFVCNNQWLPDVMGCRGRLWQKEWPGKEWDQWTYAEHEREHQQQKLEACVQILRSLTIQANLWYCGKQVMRILCFLFKPKQKCSSTYTCVRVVQLEQKMKTANLWEPDKQVIRIFGFSLFKPKQ